MVKIVTSVPSCDNSNKPSNRNASVDRNVTHKNPRPEERNNTRHASSTRGNDVLAGDAEEQRQADTSHATEPAAETVDLNDPEIMKATHDYAHMPLPQLLSLLEERLPPSETADETRVHDREERKTPTDEPVQPEREIKESCSRSAEERRPAEKRLNERDKTKLEEKARKAEQEREKVQREQTEKEAKTLKEQQQRVEKERAKQERQARKEAEGKAERAAKVAREQTKIAKREQERKAEEEKNAKEAEEKARSKQEKEIRKAVREQAKRAERESEGKTEQPNNLREKDGHNDAPKRELRRSHERTEATAPQPERAERREETRVSSDSDEPESVEKAHEELEGGLTPRQRFRKGCRDLLQRVQDHQSDSDQELYKNLQSLAADILVSSEYTDWTRALKELLRNKRAREGSSDDSKVFRTIEGKEIYNDAMLWALTLYNINHKKDTPLLTLGGLKILFGENGDANTLAWAMLRLQENGFEQFETNPVQIEINEQMDRARSASGSTPPNFSSERISLSGQALRVVEALTNIVRDAKEKAKHDQQLEVRPQEVSRREAQIKDAESTEPLPKANPVVEEAGQGTVRPAKHEDDLPPSEPTRVVQIHQEKQTEMHPEPVIAKATISPVLELSPAKGNIAEEKRTGPRPEAVLPEKDTRTVTERKPEQAKIDQSEEKSIGQRTAARPAELAPRATVEPKATEQQLPYTISRPMRFFEIEEFLNQEPKSIKARGIKTALAALYDLPDLTKAVAKILTQSRRLNAVRLFQINPPKENPEDQHMISLYNMFTKRAEIVPLLPQTTDIDNILKAIAFEYNVTQAKNNMLPRLAVPIDKLRELLDQLPSAGIVLLRKQKINPIEQTQGKTTQGLSATSPDAAKRMILPQE